MHRAPQHAKQRTLERRQRLAQEAARLMAEGGIRDFHQAKLKAAARFGVHDDQSLPKNIEIQQALREYQRLFQADSQPQLLRERREAARQAMLFMARFEPRLVGAVLDGTAGAHSPVTLQLYTDDPDSVALFLHEHGIPFDTTQRRVRLDRDRSDSFPVHVFSADGLPIDLTVLPRTALHQPPLDPRDERPFRRASLSGIDELLEE